MLKKRIIPCLDIREGRTVKGVQFKHLRDVGDPVALAAQYNAQGADELVLLDISATLEGRSAMRKVIRRVAAEVRIPFTVGGGIRTLDDAARILDDGADKVSINSSAVARPELIGEIAARYGSQSVVVALDVGCNDGSEVVFTHGGSKATALQATDWAMRAESEGAGELLVTSMRSDGTRAGFDLPLMETLEAVSNLPLIASGGAGSADHFRDLFQNTTVQAGLAATLFHDNILPIPQLKSFLKNASIPIR